MFKFGLGKHPPFPETIIAFKSLTQEDEGVSVGADSANHPG
jgi:hypothetical protein